MFRTVSYSLLVTLLCTAKLAVAQQMPADKGYFNRLPSTTWVDDTHYYTYSIVNGRSERFITDAATGKQVASPRTVAASAPVNIGRKGDIVFADKTTITGIETPAFSPDSTKVAFTRNRNLFVLDIATRKEWQVTTDGSAAVGNGYASWVYNEEILGRGMNYRAFWWSPDSRSIAFFRSDESKVPVHNVFNDEGQHGKTTPIHYPKAGDPNPEVRVGIAHVSTQKITWADYNAKDDQYFGAPYWRPDSKAVWVQWMNRRQDSLKVDEIDLSTGAKKNIYTEHQSTWISLDAEDRITFVPGKNLFILMSDKSGWMHLYTHDLTGKPLQQLTAGDWEVEKIEYVDEKAGIVYFTGRKEKSTRLDLYKVGLNGKGFQRLTSGEFNHRVVLSPGGSYFSDTYSNVSTPAKQVLISNKGKLIRELGDERGPKFAEYVAEPLEIMYVKTSDGFDLPVRISWPLHYDPSKKYPVLVNIYGGPGRKNVTDGYIGGFRSAPNENLIMITMDHRGSGHFGKKGQDYLYGKLGTWEIADYSTVMKALIAKYPSIDASRIGITGFSYGGYLTCLAVTKGADVFSYGLAGGSVTDWLLYDTHYTERYMGLPANNADGYKAASVFPYVNQYKGMLSLSQGTVDDNVHMQNTIQLVNALEQAGKRFQLHLYPGAAHGWFFMHEKQAHFVRENQAFINTYLLRKNIELIQPSNTTLP